MFKAANLEAIRRTPDLSDDDLRALGQASLGIKAVENHTGFERVDAQHESTAPSQELIDELTTMTD